MQNRLDKALALGAKGVINGAKQDTVAELLKVTDGMGFDLAIETAGTEITTNQAIDTTIKGGTIVLVGYSKSGMINIKASNALNNELTFKTVFRYRHIYPMAIDAVASGAIDLKGVVTNVFDFDELPEALEKCVTNKAEIVKAAIRVDKNAKA